MSTGHVRPGDDGFVPYANGLTFVPYCLHCPADATEMVGPVSLCGPCATAEREAFDLMHARARAWADSPEGRREIAREHLLESRVS